MQSLTNKFGVKTLFEYNWDTIDLKIKGGINSFFEFLRSKKMPFFIVEFFLVKMATEVIEASVKY